MTAHAIASENTSPSDRILRPRNLSARLGLSLATLWRLRRRGDLPEPIRLSPGCVGWRASDIEAWLTARAECRK
jgi:prophage regulatory protein